MKAKRVVAAIICAAAGLLWLLLVGAVGGCQQYVKVAWEPPEPAAGAGQRTVLAVGDLSKLNRESKPLEGKAQDEVIGKHTFTVFAIPVGSINADETTPVKPSFDKAIRDGLRAAGYDLVEAARAPAGSPVLRGEVQDCWWWSYSWFWPLFIQGGQNKVELFLEKPDGTMLWHKKFSRAEPGVSFGGSFGFDLMMKWSMTKLVKDVRDVCASDEFRTALGGPERIRP